jgi:hypothetical protein
MDCGGCGPGQTCCLDPPPPEWQVSSCGYHQNQCIPVAGLYPCPASNGFPAAACIRNEEYCFSPAAFSDPTNPGVFCNSFGDCGGVVNCACVIADNPTWGHCEEPDGPDGGAVIVDY